MAGAKTFDTDKLVRLMGVAVVIVIVLIAVAVGMVVLKDVSNFIPGTGSHSAPDQTGSQNIPGNPAVGQPTVPANDPSYDPVAEAREAYIRALNEAAAKENKTDKSVDDSVREIPVYGPEKANTLSATSPKENGNISLGYYQVIFEKKYDYRKMMGNSSLLVDVNRGPLIVHYEVSNPTVSMSTEGTSKDKDKEKKYDSYDDSRKITGLPFENPNYCNAAITIIDNKTGKIAAYDGFGITDSSVTKKDVTVYSAGEYLIYCTGTGLDIDVKVITGATEDNPNAIAVDTAAKDAFSSLTRSGTKTVKTGSGSTTSSNNVNDESIPPWERW